MTRLAVLDGPLARELLAAPLVASLSTLSPEGTIHAVAVWFSWDGEAVCVATSGASAKVRNLEQDSRATVMLHDSPGGMDVRGLTIAGRATIVRGEEARAINDRIHRKYVHADGLRLPSVGSFLAADDVTIRLVPERASAWDETGTDAAQELRASGRFVDTARALR